MTTPRVKRKLSAVLHADVKGYSRLMSEDETETLRALTGHREVLFSMVQLHGGRVVDTAGDGFLLEFHSVVDAVAFAVEFQREIRARNAGVPQDRKLEFRIGINVGDVIEDGDNIYGDGVNIAARLESLAEPGGICLSGTAYDQLKRKLTLDYEFMGEKSVKNIPEPVRTYRVRMESPQEQAVPPVPGVAPVRRARWAVPVAAAVLAAVVAVIGLWYFSGHAPRSALQPVTEPSKPSIESQEPCLVVLPFTQSKRDQTDQYFGDGLSAEMANVFAMNPDFCVIAPHSALRFRTRPVDVNAVRGQLDVSHILEGSFSREGGRVKIEARLRDAAKGAEVWTKSYDHTDKDVFMLTREIPLAVTGAMNAGIPDAVKARLANQTPPTRSGEAYAKFLEGLACYSWGGKELHSRAQELFEQAVSLDPDYAQAYAALARTYLQEARPGWSKQPAVAIAKSFELAQKALSLNNAVEAAQSTMANLLLRRREHDQAVLQVEKALATCPGDPDALATLGMILVYAGKPEEALKPITRAIRLNPLTPSSYFQILGDAYAGASRYEEAIATYNKGLLSQPESSTLRMRLVATYSLAGKEKEAHEAAAELLRAVPAFSVARVAGQILYKNDADRERFVQALRKAGLK
jgi:adenylate cyclase